MPDWSYRTVFRPILLRLPFGLARDFCLGFMGRLGRLPLGGSAIDFLGHMRPDNRLQTQIAGLNLASPVILGPWLDANLLASAALSRFGFGMMEVGPFTAAESPPAPTANSDVARQCLRVPDPLPAKAASNRALTRLQSSVGVPVMVRLAHAPGHTPEETTNLCGLTLRSLRSRHAAISLATVEQAVVDNWPLDSWRVHVNSLVHAIGEACVPAPPLLLVIPADTDKTSALPYLQTALESGARGLIVDGRVREPSGDWLIGRPALCSSVAIVYHMRADLGPTVSIIAGGADDPESALQLLAAGADAVQIDAAVAFAGPGLPKRINDAILSARCSLVADHNLPDLPAPAEHVGAMSWLWALALGVAMLIGGALALAIATTRVVLPYDEEYLGMTAQQLTAEVNPRLLAFMAHDRVTLAGTMLAVGIQYAFLALFGIRRGLHWAKVTVLASALTGFSSFFMFLGFGYFDPFHAFVTAILFQFLLLAFVGRLGLAEPPAHPNLRDDWQWLLAQWGQLLLIIEAVTIIAAGATICTIGSTSVFVHEDLAFMQTTAEAIRSANPRLVPVVAHDRASFGGMLLSVGVATLLPALWGIRQGQTWLWWMLALAGTIGYGATLVIHLRVGYTDIHHLAPALGGLALLWLSLTLLFPLLRPASPTHREHWASLIAALQTRKT